MQTLFLPAVLLLSSFILTLIAFTAYSLWHDEKNKDKSQAVKPIEENHDNPTEKANAIISHAQEEARRILAEAELAGIRTIATKKVHTASLEKDYEKDLTTLASETLKELNVASNEVKKRYEQFITESENIIAHHISQNQARLDTHIVEAIEANDKAFQTFLASQQHKLDEAFTKEISQVQSLVSNYYKKRLELVDAQIVELVTETTKITLGRSLDFSDHTAIILEALETAKANNFFSTHDTTK